MPAQFLLNILIAVLWTLLMDEDAFHLSTFIAGYLAGVDRAVEVGVFGAVDHAAIVGVGLDG